MTGSTRAPLAALLTLVLDVSWYGVLAGLALVACVAAYSAAGDLSNVSMDVPVSFGVQAQIVQVTASALNVATAELEKATGSGRLKFTPPPSRAFLLLTSVGLMAALALAAWGVSQLRAVFRTVRDGRPFVAANAARIRRVGYLVIAGELGRVALTFAGGSLASFRLSAGGLVFGGWPQLDLLPILAGLSIIAIAEVFREGTRLDEEQSLTV